MKANLVVLVLGNRKSGKSKTWNELFNAPVRTGMYVRQLYFNSTEYIDVFLVSGSPEERETYVGDIIGQQTPRVVLCSMQYRADVTRTIDYFVQNDYGLYTQWLNPGFSDSSKQTDSISLIPYLLDRGAILSIRNGTHRLSARVREMRDFIYGWAHSRNLVLT